MPSPIDLSESIKDFYLSIATTNTEPYLLYIENWLSKNREINNDNKILAIVSPDEYHGANLLAQWMKFHEKCAGFKDIVIDHFSIKGQMENKYDYSIFKFIFSLKEKLKLPKKMDLDETQLRLFFSDWLDQANLEVNQQQGGLIILVLDAIDTLTDSEGKQTNPFIWFPRILPEKVRVINPFYTLSSFLPKECQKQMTEYPIKLDFCQDLACLSLLRSASLSCNGRIEDLNSLIVSLTVCKGIPQFVEIAIKFITNQLSNVSSELIFRILFGVLGVTYKGLPLEDIATILKVPPEEAQNLIEIIKPLCLSKNGYFKLFFNPIKDASNSLQSIVSTIKRGRFSQQILNLYHKDHSDLQKMQELFFQASESEQWFKLKDYLTQIQYFILFYDHYENHFFVHRYWVRIAQSGLDPVEEYIRGLEEFILIANPSREGLFAIFLQISLFFKEFSNFQVGNIPEFRHPQIKGSVLLDKIGILKELQKLHVASEITKEQKQLLSNITANHKAPTPSPSSPLHESTSFLEKYSDKFLIDIPKNRDLARQKILSDYFESLSQESQQKVTDLFETEQRSFESTDKAISDCSQLSAFQPMLHMLSELFQANLKEITQKQQSIKSFSETHLSQVNGKNQYYYKRWLWVYFHLASSNECKLSFSEAIETNYCSKFTENSDILLLNQLKAQALSAVKPSIQNKNKLKKGKNNLQINSINTPSKMPDIKAISIPSTPISDDSMISNYNPSSHLPVLQSPSPRSSKLSRFQKQDTLNSSFSDSIFNISEDKQSDFYKQYSKFTNSANQQPVSSFQNQSPQYDSKLSTRHFFNFKVPSKFVEKQTDPIAQHLLRKGLRIQSLQRSQSPEKSGFSAAASQQWQGQRKVSQSPKFLGRSEAQSLDNSTRKVTHFENDDQIQTFKEEISKNANQEFETLKKQDLLCQQEYNQLVYQNTQLARDLKNFTKIETNLKNKDCEEQEVLAQRKQQKDIQEEKFKQINGITENIAQNCKRIKKIICTCNRNKIVSEESFNVFNSQLESILKMQKNEMQIQQELKSKMKQAVQFNKEYLQILQGRFANHEDLSKYNEENFKKKSTIIQQIKKFSTQIQDPFKYAKSQIFKKQKDTDSSKAKKVLNVNNQSKLTSQIKILKEQKADVEKIIAPHSLDEEFYFSTEFKKFKQNQDIQITLKASIQELEQELKILQEEKRSSDAIAEVIRNALNIEKSTSQRSRIISKVNETIDAKPLFEMKKIKQTIDEELRTEMKYQRQFQSILYQCLHSINIIYKQSQLEDAFPTDSLSLNKEFTLKELETDLIEKDKYIRKNLTEEEYESYLTGNLDIEDI